MMPNYWIIVNDEMKMFRREAVVAYFEAMSQNFLGGIEDNHEI
jgi:hypothetical protein